MKITKARADAILRAIDRWEDRPLPETEQAGYQTLRAWFSLYLEHEGFGPDSAESYRLTAQDDPEGAYGLRWDGTAWILVGHGWLIDTFATTADLFTFVRKGSR